MRDYRIETSPCLNCGKPLDGALAVNGNREPREGDITICAGCGHLMGFTAEGVLRDLSDDEIVDIAGDPDLLKAQRAIKETKERIANKPTQEQEMDRALEVGTEMADLFKHAMKAGIREVQYHGARSRIAFMGAAATMGAACGVIAAGFKLEKGEDVSKEMVFDVVMKNMHDRLFGDLKDEEDDEEDQNDQGE